LGLTAARRDAADAPAANIKIVDFQQDAGLWIPRRRQCLMWSEGASAADPAAGASPGHGNPWSLDRGGEPAVAGLGRWPLGLGS
jgi:hypothetical protein